MNLFKKLFGRVRQTEADTEPVKESDNNDVVEVPYVKFKRVFSGYDLPDERHSFSFWDVICIRDTDKVLLEKLYNHLTTAHKIYYMCDSHGIICSVDTKKFGYCYLYLRYSLDFTEFGIYRSGTRYDINYAWEMESCPELYNFLSGFVSKARKEYLYDKNL